VSVNARVSVWGYCRFAQIGGRSKGLGFSSCIFCCICSSPTQVSPTLLSLTLVLLAYPTLLLLSFVLTRLKNRSVATVNSAQFIFVSGAVSLWIQSFRFSASQLVVIVWLVTVCSLKVFYRFIFIA